MRGLGGVVDLDHDAQPHRRQAEPPLTCMGWVWSAGVPGAFGGGGLGRVMRTSEEGETGESMG